MEDDLGIYELALINAGPRLAVRAAVAGLLESDRLRCSDGLRVYAFKDARAHADPLEAEVIAVAGVRVHREALIVKVSTGDAVRSLEERLAARGLVLRATHRLALVAAYLLLTTGLVAVALVEPLAWLRVVLFTAAMVVFLSSARRWRTSAVATRAGARALRTRQRAAKAGHDQTPLGAAELVALFGARSLWALHPALASRLGVPRYRWQSIDSALTVGCIGHASHGFGHAWAPSPASTGDLGLTGGSHDGGGFGFGGHGGGGHAGGHG